MPIPEPHWISILFSLEVYSARSISAVGSILFGRFLNWSGALTNPDRSSQRGDSFYNCLWNYTDRMIRTFHKNKFFSAEREARQNMLTNEEKEIIIEQAKLEREKNRQAKLEKRQKQQEYQNILYRLVNIQFETIVLKLVFIVNIELKYFVVLTKLSVN